MRVVIPAIILISLQNDACTKLQAGVRYKSEARTDEAVRFVHLCSYLFWGCLYEAMDKTLTPSPWTTPMDYPNGLPLNGLPLKNTISNEYY